MSESPSDAEHKVLAFVAAINAHDPSAVVAMCSREHVFVNSLGHRLRGSDPLQQAWQWYFATFPDFRIEVEAMAVATDCVLLNGSASATHLGTGIKWSIPAAWMAKIEGEHVSHWQVYADNKPVYEILNRGT